MTKLFRNKKQKRYFDLPQHNRDKLRAHFEAGGHVERLGFLGVWVRAYAPQWCKNEVYRCVDGDQS